MAETKRKTPAIPIRPEQPYRSAYTGFVQFGTGDVAPYSQIYYRTRILHELAVAAKLVLPQYFSFPYQQQAVAATPVIPFRSSNLVQPTDPGIIRPLVGQPISYKRPLAPIPFNVVRVEFGNPLPLPRSKYFEFPNGQPPGAVNIIPYRMRRLDELVHELPLPRSGFYTFPYSPQQAAVTPVIGYRLTPWFDQPTPLVQPYVYKFPYFEQAANPPIAPRSAKQVPPYDIPLPRSEYQRFPYFDQPANPPVPYRQAKLVQPSPDPIPTTGYFKFPYVAQAQAAFPVIPFRRGQLDSLDTSKTTRFPSFQSYAFFEPAANPVIPLRQSPQPLPEPRGIPRAQYFAFPYVPQAQASSPIIPYRIAPFPHLDAAPLTRTGYTFFPYFQAAPAAPPVIGYRTTPIHRQPPLTPQQSAYFRFPYFQQAAANTIIPFRTRQLEEFGVPPAFPQAHYITFPYFNPAPANPVIPFRIAPLVHSDAGRHGQSFYTRFPYFPAAQQQTAYLPFRTAPLAHAFALPVPVARYFDFPYFVQPVVPPPTIDYQGDGKKRRRKKKKFFNLFDEIEHTIRTTIAGPVSIEDLPRASVALQPVPYEESELDRLFAEAAEYEDLSLRVENLRRDVSAYKSRRDQEIIEDDDDDMWILM